MGQTPSNQVSTCNNPETKVVYHPAGYGERGSVKRIEIQKHPLTSVIDVDGELHLTAPVKSQVLKGDAAAESPTELEKISGQSDRGQFHRAVHSSVIKCRKCTMVGVDANRYCLHLPSGTAQSLEGPEFSVASLPPEKYAAVVWHLLSNLGIIRRFKVSRHAVLCLVSGMGHVHGGMGMTSEWLRSLDLAHAVYVILRRRQQNVLALGHLFEDVDMAPSIGDGVDYIHALSLVLAALTVSLNDAPEHVRREGERLLSPEISPRKCLAWRVIQQTGKQILLRLTKAEELRVELVVDVATCAMNHPASLHDYAASTATASHIPAHGAHHGTQPAQSCRSSGDALRRSPLSANLHATYIGDAYGTHHGTHREEHSTEHGEHGTQQDERGTHHGAAASEGGPGPECPRRPQPGDRHGTYTLIEPARLHGTHQVADYGTQHGTPGDCKITDTAVAGIAAVA